jgi:hypothetical protein
MVVKKYGVLSGDNFFRLFSFSYFQEKNLDKLLQLIEQEKMIL